MKPLTICVFEVNLGVAVIRFHFTSFKGLEVFSPSGASSVLLQPFFFRTPEGDRQTLLNNESNTKVNGFGSACTRHLAESRNLTLIYTRHTVTEQRAYRFWNHTCTTLMSRPVSWANCSRTCLAGFGELLYASFNTSIWRVVIVVRGRLLPSLLSETISQGFLNDMCAIALDSRTSWLSCFKVLLAK